MTMRLRSKFKNPFELKDDWVNCMVKQKIPIKLQFLKKYTSHRLLRGVFFTVSVILGSRLIICSCSNLIPWQIGMSVETTEELSQY